MEISAIFSDLSNKIIKLTESSPISDMDKNVHALIQGAFTKMDLVSRQEFDTQVVALQSARKKLAALEQKLVDLELQLQASR